ncbi:hypothetical protein JB92DRAFT_2263081 [Gautieria morchelliformis]|nr:hypothetical protein JB92DRAFT_2263081 [Gautieria morchelliformis]
MGSYTTYPQGYGAQYGPQYPAMIPPNQFYGQPAPQPYNGYAEPYQTRYRRPSDPGPKMREPKSQSVRRGRSSRPSENEVPRISRPMARTRRPSMRAGIAPDFIFITLSSHDTLKIANITHYRALQEYLRLTLFPHWPHRIVNEYEDRDTGEWHIKLGSDVWSAGGTHGIMARRFVCRLFAVMAEEGFGYLATVDNHPVSK